MYVSTRNCFAVFALVVASLLANSSSAQARSAYDNYAYYYLEEGRAYALELYQETGENDLYEAYVWANYAEYYAYVAIAYNSQVDWLYAEECAWESRQYALESGYGYYLAEYMYLGEAYSYYAYLYFR